VSAQSLMGRALRAVEPRHLAMIAKLRAPPRILCAVLEMVLILLHEPMADLADATGPTLEKAAATWPRAQPLLEQAGGKALHARLCAFDVGTLDPEVVELLEPYLASVTHEQVHSYNSGAPRHT
jgi:hypothetical protein